MAAEQVLITGGAGFLGSHLATRFVAEGVRVRIFDIAAAPGWAAGPGIEYIQGDIRKPEEVRAAVRGVRSVIHSAFASPRMSPAIMDAVNAGGARILATACLGEGVRRLVLISSTIVERKPRRHPFLANAGLNALDAYRETRARAEQIAGDFAERGLAVAMVRPKTFVGPGRISAFNIMFDWIRRGKPVLLLGGAAEPYQLLDIRDMAEGIRLLEGSTAEGVFHFGAAVYGSLREDLEGLIKHAGTGSRLRLIPAPLARGLLRGLELSGAVTPSELHYMSAGGRPSVADISRAGREIGWAPRWSNDDALAASYDWYVRSMNETGQARSIHVLPGSHRAVSRLVEMILR